MKGECSLIKANRNMINLSQALRRAYYFHNSDERARFVNFHNEVKDGLSYPCICCHQLFMKKTVSPVNLEGLNELLDGKSSDFFQYCIKTPISENMFVNGKTYLCHTCNRNYLKKLKRPPLSYQNGLCIEELPEQLKLSDLEHTLIAKNILFLKIYELPISRWSAVKDRTINVENIFI